MNARDTVATPDGFVDLIVEVGTPNFRFEFFTGGRVLQGIAPWPLLSGRVAVDGRGMAYALVCGGGEHALFDMTGQESCRFTFGNRGWYAIRALSEGVEIHGQGATDDGGATAIFSAYNMYGGLLRQYRAPYSSEGIAYVTGPDSILSTAANARSGPGDLAWWQVSELGGFRLGQINRIPPGGDNNGTIGLMTPDGHVFIAALVPGWDGYSNAMPYLAVNNGAARVAMQDPSPDNHAPAPDEIHWLALDDNYNLPQPEQPPAPPVPEPPPPVPEPIPEPAPTPLPTPEPPPPPVPAEPDADDLVDEIIDRLLERLRKRLRDRLRDRLRRDGDAA